MAAASSLRVCAFVFVHTASTENEKPLRSDHKEYPTVDERIPFRIFPRGDTKISDI